MTATSLTYINYYPTISEAEACVKTLPFGGSIELKNGWFHVWANN